MEPPEGGKTGGRNDERKDIMVNREKLWECGPR